MNIEPAAPTVKNSPQPPAADAPEISAGVVAANPRLPLVTYLLAAGTFLMGTTEFLIAGLLRGIARRLPRSGRHGRRRVVRSAWLAEAAGDDGAGHLGAEHGREPPGLLVSGLIERRVQQPSQGAGFAERRLAMPDEIDHGAIGGSCCLARCSGSHLVASPLL
jgi:hypothetical protein